MLSHWVTSILEELHGIRTQTQEENGSEKAKMHLTMLQQVRSMQPARFLANSAFDQLVQLQITIVLLVIHWRV